MHFNLDIGVNAIFHNFGNSSLQTFLIAYKMTFDRFIKYETHFIESTRLQRRINIFRAFSATFGNLFQCLCISANNCLLALFVFQLISLLTAFQSPVYYQQATCSLRPAQSHPAPLTRSFCNMEFILCCLFTIQNKNQSTLVLLVDVAVVAVAFAVLTQYLYY